MKSDQSVKSKGILEPQAISSPESTIFVPNNIEPHDSSLDVERRLNYHLEFLIQSLVKLRTQLQYGTNYPTERNKHSPVYLLCYQQRPQWRLHKMYHGIIILRPHRRIKPLHTVRSDFKEQITTCDHDTIGLFPLLTLTSKWTRAVLLEKCKYSLHTRLYFQK